jgi:hypothetical protein
MNIYNDEKKQKRLKKLRWYLSFDEDNFLSISPSMLFSFYDNEDEDNININNELNFFGGINKNNNLSLYGSDSFNEKEKDSIYDKFVNNNESLNIKNDISEYKEIIISDDIINNLLDKEENPLFYIVKLIAITITIFCRETMCHLNSIYHSNNNKYAEIIKEYIKRFNNFVQASKYINSQCENINVAMNYLDKDILDTYPHFPKFSIFRLCIKIWYVEMCSILTIDNCSVMSKIKQSIIKLFTEFVYEDLTSISINTSSFQSFLFNSGQSSSIFFKSKGDFNLSTSISLFNSNSNNQTLSSTICPLGSYYEDSNIKYTIIEKSLSIVFETFSDEYSVYLFNLSNIETNNYYESIENNIIELIENSIKQMFNNNINKQSNDSKSFVKNIVDKILNYFNNYFYSKKIINKLKKRIYSTVIQVLKNLIFEQIEIKIKKLISNSKKNQNNQSENEDTLDSKYINELQKYLSEKKIHLEINELKKIITKITENLFEVLSDMDKWLEKEMLVIENTDKKVLKELGKNNISSNYNNLQRYLLSFSVKNNWETIRKIRTIENYHLQLNCKTNKNKSNSLQKSVNAYAMHDDLNNLNNFYSEDLDNFGNIDYFGDVNNNTTNNNNLMNTNNHNLNSGINSLRSSAIFFG